MSLRVWVEAAELLGPGLPGWEAALPVLRGEVRHRPAPCNPPPPARLLPAERRRAIPSVRLALAVAEAATARAGRDPAHLPAVFASSGADGETIGAVLTALALPAREVSPTRFHNSVHNAPSGYWSLAVQSRDPVTSLSGYDASFPAGLLEAAVQAGAGTAALLVAYDLPYPTPLDAIRPLGAGFAVALVLAAACTAASLAALDLDVTAPAPADRCADAGLEALRSGTPAARALPLLVALAKGTTGLVHLDFNRAGLHVAVAPCC